MRFSIVLGACLVLAVAGCGRQPNACVFETDAHLLIGTEPGLPVPPAIGDRRYMNIMFWAAKTPFAARPRAVLLPGTNGMVALDSTLPAVLAARSSEYADDPQPFWCSRYGRLRVYLTAGVSRAAKLGTIGYTSIALATNDDSLVWVKSNIGFVGADGARYEFPLTEGELDAAFRHPVALHLFYWNPAISRLYLTDDPGRGDRPSDLSRLALLPKQAK